MPRLRSNGVAILLSLIGCTESPDRARPPAPEVAVAPEMPWYEDHEALRREGLSRVPFVVREYGLVLASRSEDERDLIEGFEFRRSDYPELVGLRTDGPPAVSLGPGFVDWSQGYHAHREDDLWDELAIHVVVAQQSVAAVRVHIATLWGQDGIYSLPPKRDEIHGVRIGEFCAAQVVRENDAGRTEREVFDQITFFRRNILVMLTRIGGADLTVSRLPDLAALAGKIDAAIRRRPRLERLLESSLRPRITEFSLNATHLSATSAQRVKGRAHAQDPAGRPLVSDMLYAGGWIEGREGLGDFAYVPRGATPGRHGITLAVANTLNLSDAATLSVEIR